MALGDWKGFLQWQHPSDRVNARSELSKRIPEDHALPDFGIKPSSVSYLDGCKVYFPDDSFVVCHFSGTGPLLRMFAEAHSEETAYKYISAWKQLLGLACAKSLCSSNSLQHIRLIDLLAEKLATRVNSFLHFDV